MDLWNPEIDDPQGLLEKLLGFPKGSLPATLEPDSIVGAAVDGDVVEEVKRG